MVLGLGDTEMHGLIVLNFLFVLLPPLLMILHQFHSIPLLLIYFLHSSLLASTLQDSYIPVQDSTYPYSGSTTPLFFLIHFHRRNFYSWKVAFLAPFFDIFNCNLGMIVINFIVELRAPLQLQIYSSYIFANPKTTLKLMRLSFLIGSIISSLNLLKN